MGKGKKLNNKKLAVKLTPAQRLDITRLVDKLIKSKVIYLKFIRNFTM